MARACRAGCGAFSFSGFKVWTALNTNYSLRKNITVHGKPVYLASGNAAMVYWCDQKAFFHHIGSHRDGGWIAAAGSDFVGKVIDGSESNCNGVAYAAANLWREYNTTKAGGRFTERPRIRFSCGASAGTVGPFVDLRAGHPPLTFTRAHVAVSGCMPVTLVIKAAPSVKQRNSAHTVRWTPLPHDASYCILLACGAFGYMQCKS